MKTSKFEFRRVPPRVTQGDRIVLFATREQNAILGEFRTKRVLKAPFEQLWEMTKHGAFVPKELLQDYFANKKECAAIEVCEPRKYTNPIPLRVIRSVFSAFFPPQDYTYLTKGHPLLSLLPKEELSDRKTTLNVFVGENA